MNKKDELKSHDWRVHTAFPDVERVIVERILASGKNPSEMRVQGQKEGRSEIFFRIDYAIAEFLEKRFRNRHFIQHRKPHKTENFFPWVEWLGGVRRASVSARIVGGRYVRSTEERKKAEERLKKSIGFGG